MEAIAILRGQLSEVQRKIQQLRKAKGSKKEENGPHLSVGAAIRLIWQITRWRCMVRENYYCRQFSSPMRLNL